MNVERTEWQIEQKQDDEWAPRGLPWHNEKSGRDQLAFLRDTFIKRQYRLVSVRWYTDTRIVDTDGE